MLKFGGPIQPEWYKRWSRIGRRVVDYDSQLHLCGVWGLYIHHEPGAKWKSATRLFWDGAIFRSTAYLPTGVWSQTPAVANKNKIIYQRFSFIVWQCQKPMLRPGADGQCRDHRVHLYTNKRVSHYVNITVSLAKEVCRPSAERPDVISMHPWFGRPARRTETERWSPASFPGMHLFRKLSYLACRKRIYRITIQYFRLCCQTSPMEVWMVARASAGGLSYRLPCSVTW